MLQIQASGSQSCVCALGKQEQRCALRIEATHCYYQSNLRVFIPLLPSVRKAVMSKYIKDNSFLFIWMRKNNNVKGMKRVPFGQVHPRSPPPEATLWKWIASGWISCKLWRKLCFQTDSEGDLSKLNWTCTGTWWFICSKYGYLTCLYIQTAKHETSLESTVCDADTEVRSDLISWISAGLHR